MLTTSCSDVRKVAIISCDFHTVLKHPLCAILSPPHPSSIHPPSIPHPSSIHPSFISHPSLIHPSSIPHPSFIHPSSILHPSLIHPSSIPHPSFIPPHSFSSSLHHPSIIHLSVPQPYIHLAYIYLTLTLSSNLCVFYMYVCFYRLIV